MKPIKSAWRYATHVSHTPRPTRVLLSRAMAARAVSTPIGTLGLVATGDGLSGVRWSANGLRDEASPILDEAVAQLEAYVAGALIDFDLPRDRAGTEVQRRCWLPLA